MSAEESDRPSVASGGLFPVALNAHKNAIRWAENGAPYCPHCDHIACEFCRLHTVTRLCKRHGKLGVHHVVDGMKCCFCGEVYDDTPF